MSENTSTNPETTDKTNEDGNDGEKKEVQKIINPKIFRVLWSYNISEFGVDKDEKETKKKTVKDYPSKYPPFILRAIFDTFCAITCVFCKLATCTGCKVSPTTRLINILAFQPPAPWKSYYLSYLNEETGMRCFGNAKQCYGKPNLRIEPVTTSKNKQKIAQIEYFSQRTKPFIFLSESGNYILGAKIVADPPFFVREQSHIHKVILLANVNGCDMGIWMDNCGTYLESIQHPDFYDVYIFDYSGYGLSTGKPSEEVVYKDIKGVYDYIVAERKDPKLEIILIGISIGSVVVIDLAAKNLPFITGVVLIAPLTSAFRHITRHSRKTTPFFDGLRSIDKVPLINFPLLCIHGTKDECTPPSNSTEISAAAKFAVDPLFIENRSHLGVLFSFRLGRRIIKFMEVDIEKWKEEHGSDTESETSDDEEIETS